MEIKNQSLSRRDILGLIRFRQSVPETSQNLGRSISTQTSPVTHLQTRRNFLHTLGLIGSAIIASQIQDLRILTNSRLTF